MGGPAMRTGLVRASLPLTLMTSVPSLEEDHTHPVAQMLLRNFLPPDLFLKTRFLCITLDDLDLKGLTCLCLPNAEVKGT